MQYKKLFFQVSLLAFFFLAAWLITRTAKRGEYISFVGFAQGTTYRITYESKKGEQYQSDVDSILNVVDMSLSIYKPNSIISRFNRNEKETLADKLFTDVFNKSYEVYMTTGGAFDITVGPIVNALGFGNKDTTATDSTKISALRSLVGMEKVKLKNGKLMKSDPGILLDVNAIAQGYSVDVVAAFLDTRKIKNYLIEIGGEVRAKGRNDRGSIWNIGIDKPVEGNNMPGADLEAIVKLDNRALATSGNYRKYYVKNGIKYVHTIDPKTGFPVVSNLLSATVVAADCTTADAYATALMVFGLNKSIEFLNHNKYLEAFLVYSDDKGNFATYLTPGMEKFIQQ